MFHSDESNSLVVDVGAHRTRVGFSGDDSPTIIFPTDIGSLQHDSNGRSLFMGTNELNIRRDFMEIKNPIQDGQGVPVFFCNGFLFFRMQELGM